MSNICFPLRLRFLGCIYVQGMFNRILSSVPVLLEAMLLSVPSHRVSVVPREPCVTSLRHFCEQGEPKTPQLLGAGTVAAP